MKNIISPIDKHLIKNELTEDKFLRKTNNGNKEIYIITHHNSPNIMLEIGRLRELSFRDAGGGTGKEVDIDEYDTSEVPYQQLLVWNPEDQEIIGGYRFINGDKIKFDKNGAPFSATAELFRFSEHFNRDYLPYTIELGRSWVQPNYQPTYNIRKGLFSLDNLWDGLGAITLEYPEMKYFFGKITMYPRFNITARDMILFFLKKYFPDPENLVYPHQALNLVTDIEELNSTFHENNYDEDYRILMKNVRRFNESIPPLVNAYMNLSSTMKTFGTAINHHFGEVEETGILVTINDIYDIKKHRHIATYKKTL
ncbi:MAG: GNAT family N-acetyltransferase [Bacteroidales bacterium]